MDETIKSAESTNSIFAILFIDLDRFKIVNDTLGHHVGDEMIKVIAKRIQNLLRKNDIVARIGGDEFVILLDRITSYNVCYTKLLRTLHMKDHSQ